MGGSEGIIDVKISHRGQPPSKLDIVVFLTTVKAQVLQQQHLPGFQLGDSLCDLPTNTRSDKFNRSAQPGSQLLSNRGQRQIFPSFPAGATQMGSQQQPPSSLQNELDGSESGQDPRIISDIPT